MEEIQTLEGHLPGIARVPDSSSRVRWRDTMTACEESAGSPGDVGSEDKEG